MLIPRNTAILAAVLLTLGLAACTTKKPATTEGGEAGQPTAGATGYGAAGAETSSAGTSGGIDSQALGGSSGQAASGATAGNPLSMKVFHFDYDSSDIQPDDFNALKAHAQYLSKTPAARVQIGGHTDERGTREYNMALGERRAKTVAAFLTSNGVNPNQLEVISYGEEKPIATGESESVWAENRRVELEYTAANP